MTPVLTWMIAVVEKLLAERFGNAFTRFMKLFPRRSKMRRNLILAKLLNCALLLLCLPLAHTIAQDLRPYFKNVEGCFVLYDLKNDRYLRYNEQRCRRRFSPFSTFKIPNSLIGLETGVIKDAEFVIPWDRVKYPPQENWNVEPFSHWGQDHTLRTAIKYSVVWYYRELATRVGPARMKDNLEKLRYGNRDISGGIDRFWLNSSLRVSPDEEVEFLKALYLKNCPSQNVRWALSKTSSRWNRTTHTS
jgi:beta-lactamase class D